MISFIRAGRTGYAGVQVGLNTTLVVMVISAVSACGNAPSGTDARGASSTGESGGIGGMGGVAGSAGSAGSGGLGGAGGNPSGLVDPQGASLFIEVFDKVTKLPVTHSWVAVGDDLRKTDGFGQVLFEKLKPGRIVARILAEGYVKSTVVADVGSGVHAGREAYLLPLGNPIALDADQGGVATMGNAQVTIPPGAFVNEAGQTVTGMVEAHVVTIDPTTDDLSAMPGPLVGRAESGETPLLSVFMADISFTQGGQQLQLAAGREAKLEFVIPDAVSGSVSYGETIPGWWFDTHDGIWIQEGEGTVQESLAQPGKLAWVANVRHFTPWNVDYLWIDYERNCYRVTVVDQNNVPLPNNPVQSVGIDYYAWNVFPNTYNATTTANGGAACVETLMRRSAAYPFAQARIQSIFGGTPVTVTGQLPARICPDPACTPITLVVPSPIICNPGAMQVCAYNGPPGSQNNPPCQANRRTCNASGTAWSACQGEVLPQPTDVCGNNVDDDCNGTIDDGCMICMPNTMEACYTNSLGMPGVGVCQSGMHQCNAMGTGFGPCMGEMGPNPAGELCDTAADDDCDGFTNENPPCVCTPLMPTTCYTGPPNTPGVGTCAMGMAICNASGTGTGPCNGQVTPVAETCGAANTTDENCNGAVNEGCASSGNMYGNGMFNQFGNAVATTAQGDIFAGGYFFGQINFGGMDLNTPNGTTSDAFLVKFSSAGNTHVWSRSYGDVAAQPFDDQVIHDNVVDANGDVYITGIFTRSIALATNHSTTALDDGFVAKINGTTGVPIWSVSLGATTAAASVKPLSIALGGDGNLAIAGTFDGSFPGCAGTCTGTGDMFVRKLSSMNGSTIWTRLTGGSGAQVGNGVAADAQGNVFVTGKTAGSLAQDGNCSLAIVAGGDDAFIAKLDTATGNCQWRQLYGDGFNQSGTSVAAAPNGDVVFVGSVVQGLVFPCGTNVTMSNQTSDVFIARLNSNGDCLWARRILDPPGATPGDQEPLDVRFDAAGNIALTGRFRGWMQWGSMGSVGSAISNLGGSWDLFVGKFLGNGTFQWVRSFGDATNDQIGRAIAFGSNNDIIVVGEAQGSVAFQGLGTQTSTGGSDVLLMRIQP